MNIVKMIQTDTVTKVFSILIFVLAMLYVVAMVRKSA